MERNVSIESISYAPVRALIMDDIRFAEYRLAVLSDNPQHEQTKRVIALQLDALRVLLAAKANWAN